MPAASGCLMFDFDTIDDDASVAEKTDHTDMSTTDAGGDTTPVRRPRPDSAMNMMIDDDADAGGPIGVCPAAGSFCDGSVHVNCDAAGEMATRVDCSVTESPCMLGHCSPEVGCKLEMLEDGINCDNGTVCTVNETCKLGVCQGGVPNQCPDLVGGVCKLSVCDELADACKLVAVDNGTACSDTASCVSGECLETECHELSCDVGCAITDSCTIDCFQAGTCDAECQNGTTCSVDCTGTQECNLDCDGGSNCVLQCGGATRCEARCRDGTSCTIICTGDTPCTVRCDSGDCLLSCEGTGTCGFSDCEGEVLQCPGGVLACGRPCPG